MRGAHVRQGGMTLIELLVAISVLALLSVLGYGAFSSLLLSRTHLVAASEQWVQLTQVFRHLERDLERLPPGGRRGLLLELVAGSEQQVLRLQSGRERIAYLFSGQGLHWASDQVDGEAQRLLPPDCRVRWRVLLADGRWVQRYAGNGFSVTRMLEMQLGCPGAEITRRWRLP
jgi:general secretion pathway protein J